MKNVSRFGVCVARLASAVRIVAALALGAAFTSAALAQVSNDVNALTVTDSSGDAVTTVTQAAGSNGNIRAFNADAIGDFVTFRVNVIAADTYQIDINYLLSSNRGIYQLSIDGVAQGLPQDLYGNSFSNLTLGERALNAGQHSFTFTVVGQNPASSGVRMGIDLITLIPVSTGGGSVAPTGLTAVATSTSTIALTWIDNSTTESSFVVERQLGTAGAFAPVTTTAANATAFTDTGLTAETNYSYRVTAVLPAGNSDYSNVAGAATESEASASTLTFDANALNVNATSGDGVTIVDQAAASNGNIRAFNADAIGDFMTLRVNVATTDNYQIKIRYFFSNNRGIYQLSVDGANQGAPQDLYGSGTLVTIDLGYKRLVAGQHKFTFTAVGKNAASSSYRMGIDVILLTPIIVPVPVAPANLAATSTIEGVVELNWIDTPSTATGYLIERRTGSTGGFATIATVASGATHFQNAGLSPSTHYSYRIAGTNDGGTSAYSNEASVMTPVSTGSANTNFDANTLGVTGSSGETIVPVTNPSANGGDFLRFDSNDIGDFISFIVDVPATSVYRLDAVFHQNPFRGIFQFKIDGVAHGSPRDLYAAASSFVAADLGDKLLSAGAHTFTFEVAGKNTAATDYQFGLDRLTLTALDTTVPAAPTDLNAQVISSNHVELEWSLSDDDVVSVLERRTLPTGTFAAIVTLDACTMSYDDLGLSGNTSYAYRVLAANAAGNSAYSEEAIVATPAAVIPEVPTELVATPISQTAVSLSWSDQADDESSTIIERQLGTSGLYTIIGSVGINVTTFNDTGLTAATAYTYRVRATNEAGTSDYSNVSEVTTPATPISVGAPSALTAAAISNTRIDLAWIDGSDNETAFKIERKTGSAGVYVEIASVPANTTSYADESATLNTTYYYRVRATLNEHSSAYSNAASVRTMALGATRAFPSAVGYGAYARGGRGGIVKYVTNLNDSGQGSLRDALTGSQPRTVIFRVGGIIQLTSTLNTGNPYVTIAGQTAPGDGVLIAGRPVRVLNSSDVVIRHIAVRPGNQGTGLDNRDAFQIEHSNNVIVDHSSFSWSVDEAFTGWFSDTSDWTVQNSVISEPLWNAGHSKGSHPMGLLVGRGVRNVTIYQNYMAHVGFRTPEFTTGTVLDVINNVVFNWGQRGVTYTPGEKEYFGPAFANIMNNIFKSGGGHNGQGSGNNGPAIILLDKEAPFEGTRLHISGNVDGSGADANAVQGSLAEADLYSSVPVGANGVPHAPWDLPVGSTTGLAESLLTHVGRSKPARDVVDTRLVSDYWTNTSRRPNSVAEAGGYPVLQSGTPYPDADLDGMDDTWELANGLNPSDPEDRNGDRDNDGYTNLEEFLNGLAGDYALNYTPSTSAPAITQQPADFTVNAGESASFSVTSTGAPAPTFQWRHAGTAISGATAATLTVTNASATNAGSYDVVVTNSAGSVTSSAAVLTVNSAPSITQQPADSAVDVGQPAMFAVAAIGLPAPTYQWRHEGQPINGATSATLTLDHPSISDSGVYDVVVSNSIGSVTSQVANLSVSKATASIILSDLNATFDGSVHAVSAQTNPSGLATTITYNGSASAPSAAGSYSVHAAILDDTFQGSAHGTLVISPANATVTLSSLRHPYDGTPKSVIATTLPANLPVTITYAGSPTAPTLPGTYVVNAFVNSANYSAFAEGELAIVTAALVQHAPSINGGVGGSVFVNSDENVTLNSSSWIAGDLLVPGSPTIRINGSPQYLGTQDSIGNAAPANYAITLNSGAVLHHVIRRINPVTLTAVGAPVAPSGTRSVSINSPQNSPGDFATLRNLTLNSNVGTVAVPAGAYGNFIINSGSAITLGAAGSPGPVVYHLQNLTINSNARVNLAGPVILHLANGSAVNGELGASGQPEWLTLNITRGSFTLNSQAVVHAQVVAPTSTVTVNGTLNGEVICDRLTVNGLLDQIP